MYLVTLDLRVAALEELATHYRAPKSTWVRANMVVSQDGQFVGENKTSRDLTNSQDLSLLLLLRALSDVLLVGANTARQENYRQPKKRAEFAFLNRPTPTLAVVSESLKFDLTSQMFSGGENQTIVFNAGINNPSDELLEVAHVIPVSGGVNFGIRVIDAIHDLGFQSVTCEGGPGLLAQLLKSRVVDEYDLTISPITVGIDSSLPNVMPDDSDWNVAGTAIAGDFQFRRYLRKEA